MAYNLLKGKRGIIFGALNDASIAWKVAERASEEGAQIVLTNTPVACRMGTIDELAKKDQCNNNSCRCNFSGRFGEALCAGTRGYGRQNRLRASFRGHECEHAQEAYV